MVGISVLPLIARRLEGKVALITGGASGIGECTARLFARHGARVIVADIQDDKGRSVCSDIGPDAASYVHCDVTDETQVGHAVDSAVAMHGKLDIMLNNAGICENFAGILESSKSVVEKEIAVNLVGVFLGTKHAARVMIPRRQGSIVILASVASVAPMATVGYTSSKHGVVGLMRRAAVEFGQYGVRANCVSPYAVATPLSERLLGMGKEEMEALLEEHATLKGARLGKEDVAHAVLYLASEESRYVTGLNLLVDGGNSLATARIKL